MGCVWGAVLLVRGLQAPHAQHLLPGPCQGLSSPEADSPNSIFCLHPKPSPWGMTRRPWMEEEACESSSGCPPSPPPSCSLWALPALPQRTPGGHPPGEHTQPPLSVRPGVGPPASTCARVSVPVWAPEQRAAPGGTTEAAGRAQAVPITSWLLGFSWRQPGLGGEAAWACPDSSSGPSPPQQFPAPPPAAMSLGAGSWGSPSPPLGGFSLSQHREQWVLFVAQIPTTRRSGPPTKAYTATTHAWRPGPLTEAIGDFLTLESQGWASRSSISNPLNKAPEPSPGSPAALTVLWGP